MLQTTARAIGQGSQQPATTTPQRLLLIRPDHLGDVLWLTPALHALRQRLPDAAIAVAASPADSAVWASSSWTLGSFGSSATIFL